LIKYIKRVLWRVAKRLSYIEDGQCLKVRDLFLEEFRDLYWAGLLPFYYIISYGQHVDNIDGGQPGRKKYGCLKEERKEQITKNMT
jgi:hypothetical protein